MEVFRILPELITVLVLAVICNGCYTNYQTCYTTFSNVPTPSGSQDTTIYCSAAETAVNCLKSDTSNCTGSESVPAMYTTYLGSMENIKTSCVQTGCVDKSLECANMSLEMADVFKTVDMTNIQALMGLTATLCPLLTRIQTCFGEISSMCPSLTASVQPQIQANGALIGQICGGGGDVNCPMKLMTCAAPALAGNCGNFSNGISTDDQIKCCGYGKTAMDCLKEANCLDIPNMPSNPLRSFERDCHGYEDYCPGLSLCLDAVNANGGLNNINNLCKKMPSLISCVESKCMGKPKIGQITLTQIATLYGNICIGLSKSPSLMQCQSFTDCVNFAPSLPGTLKNLQSTLALRDTNHWCKIAKTYMSCAATESTDNTCSIGGTFSADVIEIKKSVDQLCVGVRDPCIDVKKCVSVLYGSQKYFTLMGTCPNIPDFVTCTNAALSKCGSSSKVKASYSLSDIGTLFSQSCQSISGLSSCAAAQTCFDIRLPENLGDRIDKFSDQTFWCPQLRQIMKCSSGVSTTCSQPQLITDKLKELHAKINKHCPESGATTEPPTCDKDCGNSANAAVASLLMSIMVILLAFL